MKSHSTSKSASTFLVLLFRLIAANDWQQLKDMFLSEPEGAKTFQDLAALVAKSSSYNGMTILHACARFNPPAVLINKMIELCPDAPSSQDCLNRTPLHVAAGTGASSAVIKVFVDSYPDACMIQDKDGRTPLMMCCDNSVELFEDSRERTHRPAPSYWATTVLLSASLDSAILEDDDGMSAIEYALCSNADLQTVQLIQSAAQKVMRKKHKEERANKAEGQVSKKGIAVIKELIDSYPDACMIQDNDGRTPPMMCCDSSCELFDDSRERAHRPAPSYESNTVRLSASLDSAILEDDDGMRSMMSAIEYALCSNADLQPIQRIQSAAQKVMRKKHKEERANKAEVQVSKKGIAVATKGFSQTPRRLLTAPSA